MFLHYRRLNKHRQSLKNTHSRLRLLKGIFLKKKVDFRNLISEVSQIRLPESSPWVEGSEQLMWDQYFEKEGREGGSTERLGCNAVSNKASAKLLGTLELGWPSELDETTTLLPLGGPAMRWRSTMLMGMSMAWGEVNLCIAGPQLRAVCWQYWPHSQQKGKQIFHS